MNVDVNIQVGLTGRRQRLSPIWLDAASIGAASQWAGSYHVLSMGEHYDDYVVTSRVLTLPSIHGIPRAHPYERLTGKIRAAGVTGNIGEAVAAIFARRYLMTTIGEIAHVRPRQPFRRRRYPDYLMRLGRSMPNIFGSILPTNQSFNWPDWWPVESKARTTGGGCKLARRDALRQLIAYWSLLVSAQPSIVGFGLIVTFAYRPPREVHVNIMLPHDQQRLVSLLRADGENSDLRETRMCLYG